MSEVGNYSEYTCVECAATIGALLVPVGYVLRARMHGKCVTLNRALLVVCTVMLLCCHGPCITGALRLMDLALIISLIIIARSLLNHTLLEKRTLRSPAFHAVHPILYCAYHVKYSVGQN